MKMNRYAYPENFMVRRGQKGRGGAVSCPNAKVSGGGAACGIGVSRV